MHTPRGAGTLWAYWQGDVSIDAADLIRAEIARSGPVSFARFMELSLYAPGQGYYASRACQLGERGDFVTAPEISPLFSRCVARQCAQGLAALGGGDILEFGAGSGAMAVEILRFLAQHDALPRRYAILEISAALRARQAAQLREQAGPWADRVVWWETLPTAFEGVMLANEVMDAMPVHLFAIKNGRIVERCVGVDTAGDGFIWHDDPPRTPGLAAAVEGLGVPLAEGYASEISLIIPAWIHSLADVLHRGLILLIDYGFPRREYYHPERARGTLMCHTRHRAHADPLIHVGRQDITAHVDFTRVAEAADAAGLCVAGYTSQAHFLLGCGLAEEAPREGGDNAPAQRFASQIKRLTSPGEMGELFKAIALTRAFSGPLLGFADPFDRRAALL